MVGLVFPGGFETDGGRLVLFARGVARFAGALPVSLRLNRAAQFPALADGRADLIRDSLMSGSGGLTTGAKVLIGILAVVGAFTLVSSIFWSLWIFLRWILGPLLLVGLIVYIVVRRRERRKR